MDLKSLIADTKEIEIEYPNLKGFKVKVVYLSKDKLRKIGEKCKSIGFDSSTRQPIESMDDEMFQKMYIESALTGWSGLKFEYLTHLMPIDLDKLPEEGELPYTVSNAVEIVSNSKEFDAWLTQVISDVSLFNKGS